MGRYRFYALGLSISLLQMSCSNQKEFTPEDRTLASSAPLAEPQSSDTPAAPTPTPAPQDEEDLNNAVEISLGAYKVFDKLHWFQVCGYHRNHTYTGPGSEALDDFQVNIYENRLEAFVKNDLELLSPQDFNNLIASLEGSPGQAHTLIAAYSTRSRSSTPVCTYTYSALKADVIKGTTEIKKHLNEKCSLSKIHSVTADVNTEREIKFYQAMIAASDKFQIDRTQFFESYHLTASRRGDLQTTFASINFSLKYDSGGKKQPISATIPTPGYLVWWKSAGELGFVDPAPQPGLYLFYRYNGAEHRRCEYDEISEYLNL